MNNPKRPNALMGFAVFLLVAIVVNYTVSSHQVARLQPTHSSPVPSGYVKFFEETFSALNLRVDQKGIWESFGGNATTFKGQAGFGYDFFANPLWTGWPSSVSDLRVITPDGLRLRARVPTAEEAALIPTVNGRTAWISSSLGTYDRLKLRPPYYIEFKARMPSGANGRAVWPALWLYGNSRMHPPYSAGKAFEIDVHEGFGSSTDLSSIIHWDTADDGSNYLQAVAVKKAAGVDLSANFHVWGCLHDGNKGTFYFDGVEVGKITYDSKSNSSTPLDISLNISAGIPWTNTPPISGPYDMTVRYVRVFKPSAPSITAE